MTYVELERIDSSVEDNPVGTYGMKWLSFMERNHAKLMRKLIANRTLVAVARSVDDRAWNYRFLLDNQYEGANEGILYRWCGNEGEGVSSVFNAIEKKTAGIFPVPS